MSTPTLPRIRFVDLVLRTCELAHVSAPQPDPTAGEPLRVRLVVDDVGFDLVHLAEEIAGLVVCSRFGKIPPDRRRESLMHALRANSRLARVHAASFGIDPGTQELVYITNDELSGITPEDLVESMTKLARHAAEWRQAGLVCV